MKTQRAFLLLALFTTVALQAVPFARAEGSQTVEFAAAHLDGRTMKFNLILPRDYASSERKFPVLYLLHGFTGHHDDWVKQTGIEEYAAGYEEIIVMPEGENSWYVNNYADPKMRWEDYMIFDLIPYVDQHYRTEAARGGRAIAGLSMGGYGAMMLGLKHPDLFSAVASLSGALASARTAFLDPISDPKIRQLFLDIFGPPDNPSRTAVDPFQLIRGIPADQMPQLYLAIGSSDFLLRENREFIRLLTDLKITFEYREVEGRHEWPVWDSQIKEVLAAQAPVIGAEK
jgi:putative tributyrin esterase